MKVNVASDTPTPPSSSPAGTFGGPSFQWRKKRWTPAGAGLRFQRTSLTGSHILTIRAPPWSGLREPWKPRVVRATGGSTPASLRRALARLFVSGSHPRRCLQPSRLDRLLRYRRPGPKYDGSLRCTISV